MSFWQQVLAGNPFNRQNPNPNFVGTSLSQGRGVPDPGVPDPAPFAPNDQPPRSVEINLGIQRELRHGMVFSADYLRNIETRNLPNFGNFNLPPNTMNGIVFGTGNGSISDTTRADNEAFRVRNGTGVYGLGAQRQIEFGLRFVF